MPYRIKVDRRKSVVLNADFNLTDKERQILNESDIYGERIISLNDNFLSLEELALDDDICDAAYYLLRNIPQELELALEAKLRILGLRKLPFHKYFFGKNEYDDPPF